MITGTTKTGFEYTIDPEKVNDMEFVELAAAAREDGLLLPKIITWVLGDEQKKALYAHVRDKHGAAKADVVGEEFTEIILSINGAKETKN